MYYWPFKEAVLLRFVYFVNYRRLSIFPLNKDKESILQDILLRSQQSVNDDVTSDMTLDGNDVSGIAKFFDSLDIADFFNIDDVRSLMNIDDVANVMNKDAMERLRVGIHGKTYCHCHSNYCQCCRTIYLFWKIPIFKGNRLKLVNIFKRTGISAG